MELIRANWNMAAPIRMITITGADLLPESEAHEQIDFFASGGGDQHEKLEKLEDAMAALRKKFGHDSIGYAYRPDDSLLSPDKKSK